MDIKPKQPVLKLLQQEYVHKKMVFVGVLTQQAYLSTRAKFLYETWGNKMDKLVFFVGEDCVVPPDLSYLPVIKLKGVPDEVYPPLKKTFAVMTYMYDHFLGQYNWFIRADDDVYIRPNKLKQLLSNMAPSEKIYLGRGGTGRKEDIDRLHLLPQELYCMGGPGIILSMAALRELGPHLDMCLNAGTYNNNYYRGGMHTRGNVTTFKSKRANVKSIFQQRCCLLLQVNYCHHHAMIFRLILIYGVLYGEQLKRHYFTIVSYFVYLCVQHSLHPSR